MIFDGVHGASRQGRQPEGDVDDQSVVMLAMR
jgi:hypothetical protein